MRKNKKFCEKLLYISNFHIKITKLVNNLENMKTFKIKNYKGNIVESLKKFSESHKGLKIVQTYLEGDDLKILVKESENINEAISNSVFAVMIHDDDKFKTIIGIGSSEKEAQKIIDNAKGWEHAKGNMKIIKLDLNREIDYSLYGLDFSESKSIVKKDNANIETEASKRKVYVLIKKTYKGLDMPIAICSSLEEAERVHDGRKEEQRSKHIIDGWPIEVFEYDSNTWNLEGNNYRFIDKWY